MKRNAIKVLLLAIVGIPIIMQYSCTDDSKSSERYDGPLKLKSFYPDSGYLSSKIIIEAENLGTDASQLSVYFNKKKGFISNASGNILMVYAPKLPGDNCVISVVKGKDTLAFDKEFRYISQFTVTNVCGKKDSPNNFNTDLASTTFQAWQLRKGCCDPDGNYYTCYGNLINNTGGLVLVSEKNNLSKKLTSTVINDIIYHKENGKIYAVASKRNFLYEVNPNDDWKVRNRYFKAPASPATTIDFTKTACIAYCSANGYFYVRAIDNILYRFKLSDMECEYLTTGVYNTTSSDIGNNYMLSMAFDPLEPTKLYTSYTNPSIISVMDVADPNFKEEVYAGHLNTQATGDRTQIINGYRTDCLFRWNSQIVIIANESGQKDMYIADAGSMTIRKIDMLTGTVTTAVGRQGIGGNQGGSPLEATFHWPRGIGLDAKGDLYISDGASGCIRKLTLR